MPDWFGRGAVFDASQAAVECVHEDGIVVFWGDEVVGVQVAGWRYRLELKEVFFAWVCDVLEFPKMPPCGEAKGGRRDGDAHWAVKRMGGERQFLAAGGGKD